MDSEFYANHGQEFHGSTLEDPRQCLEIVAHAAPSVLYLRHQAAVVNLTRKGGPNTTFKVFGSPYSQFDGNWAFGYANGKDATALWDDIPSDSDIVVTHTPPQSHCDQKPTGKSVGCNALRQALRRIRPSLALCGHVHEGRGYQRVRWQSTRLNADEVIQGVLPPPGSKKQALIDLTGRRETKLDNEGFSASLDPSPLHLTQASISSTRLDGSVEGICSKAPALSACSHEVGDGDDDRVDGHPGQTLRRETCIVNAAILATSWPHRGGKRFNTPIVVDIELPVRPDSHASLSPVK